MKKSLILVLVLVFFVTNFSSVSAASGSREATGEVLYVNRIDGIIGWAKEPDGKKIEVDIYVSEVGKTAADSVCSAGGVTADQFREDTYNRFGERNGYLFSFNNECIRNLNQGKYRIHLALGPDRFARSHDFVIRKTKNFDLWMHYLGDLINRKKGLYDSYPTVIREEDEYKMWYVSPEVNGDTIFYAESSNGIDWNLIEGPRQGGAVLHVTKNNCTCKDKVGGSCPEGSSFSGDDMHTADPSVVKVGGVYYLYYVGASKKFSCFGCNNQVFLATSSDGIHWTKHQNQGKPIPVLSPVEMVDNPENCGPWIEGYPSWYGAGQPSVLYRDYDHDNNSEFLIYFSDFTNNTKAQSLAIGESGESFPKKEHGVTSETTWDVKYSLYLNQYIAFNAIPTIKDTPGLILLQLSKNGVDWQSIGTSNVGGRRVLISMDELTSDVDSWVINNGGLLGEETGTLKGRNTIFYFGAGSSMQNGYREGEYVENNTPSGETTWDIAGLDVWMTRRDLCAFCEQGLAKSKGNADCNNTVNVIDFSEWRAVYEELSSQEDKVDFNCKNSQSYYVVDLDDLRIFVGNYAE